MTVLGGDVAGLVVMVSHHRHTSGLLDCSGLGGLRGQEGTWRAPKRVPAWGRHPSPCHGKSKQRGRKETCNGIHECMKSN